MSDIQKEEWVDWINVKLLQKVVILDADNNILLIKKNPHRLGERVGNWDLVGGSVNGSDLIITKHPHLEALTREIREETGLVINGLTPFVIRSGVKTRQNGEKVLIYFVIFKAYIASIKPEITLSNEHVEYQWLHKEQALQQNFGNDGGEYREILEKV